MNLEQSILRMDRHKHWRIQVVNNGDRRRYEVTIWGNGKRQSASAASVVAAIAAAESKLVNPLKLKLIKG